VLREDRVSSSLEARIDGCGWALACWVGGRTGRFYHLNTFPVRGALASGSRLPFGGRGCQEAGGAAVIGPASHTDCDTLGNQNEERPRKEWVDPMPGASIDPPSPPLRAAGRPAIHLKAEGSKKRASKGKDVKEAGADYPTGYRRAHTFTEYIRRGCTFCVSRRTIQRRFTIQGAAVGWLC